jgi:AAA domain
MQTTLNPMIPLTQIVPRTLDWLWPDRLALGKLAMFDGDPGRGKSLVTLDLCARVTTGRPMPDGTGAAPPATVAIIQGEDYADDTVAPRLLSLGADLKRVFIFGDDVLRTHGPFSLPSQIAMLDEALKANTPRLLIIDPIMAFLDRDILGASDQSIRRALSPLGQLADEHRCAMILVRHMNKNSSLQSMYRGGGSIGFNAACRSSWLFTDDPRDRSRLLMAQIKNNLAGPQPTLAYRILRESCIPPRLDWLGPTGLTADQLLGLRRKPDPLFPREHARDFLAELFQTGPQPTTSVWDAAQACGLKKRTIQTARHDLSIRSLRVWTGEKHVTWWLMPGQRLPDTIPPEHRPDDIDDLFAHLREKHPADPLEETDDGE